MKPPSFRFFDRRVYVGPVFVVVSAMRQGAQRWSAARLWRLVGVSYRTLRRWLAWWRTAFVSSRFWLQARGDFMPPVDEKAVPLSLLERFTATGIFGRAPLLCVLRFLLPLTTGATVQAR